MEWWFPPSSAAVGFEMGEWKGFFKNSGILKTLTKILWVWSLCVWGLWVYRIEKPKALSLMLHSADISHPAKAWELHHRWTMSLLEEFFRQVPCCFGPLTGVICGRSLAFIFQQHSNQDFCDYSYLPFEGMVHSFYFLAFWSCDVWLSPTFWFSECYGALSYAFLFGVGEAFPFGNLLSKYHLRYAFTFFFSHCNLLLCYNWLGCSFLADNPMLSNAKPVGTIWVQKIIWSYCSNYI